MIPADKMPESESKAKHNDSRWNSHASARMPYMKPKYIQKIPLKQIRSCSPGRGFANQRFALRFGLQALACSQIKDLLSDSGLRPSLVHKSVDLLSDSGLRPSLVHKSIDLLSDSGLRPSLVLKSVDLLSDSGLRPSLVHKSIDLLSDSGLRPSLVRKSKICSQGKALVASFLRKLAPLRLPAAPSIRLGRGRPCGAARLNRKPTVCFAEGEPNGSPRLRLSYLRSGLHQLLNLFLKCP
ncbi:hypothetical protein SDC9_41151 [bioreactor metagenome]|uniref:Uncharacterized protein n=1 Tax=bioreactor metagenome TaxID=1076179 RepID=A0A644VUE9_9ZZZZ